MASFHNGLSGWPTFGCMVRNIWLQIGPCIELHIVIGNFETLPRVRVLPRSVPLFLYVAFSTTKVLYSLVIIQTLALREMNKG